MSLTNAHLIVYFDVDKEILGKTTVSVLSNKDGDHYWMWLIANFYQLLPKINPIRYKIFNKTEVFIRNFNFKIIS